MRERLARVAGKIVAAAQRRAGVLPPDTATALAAVTDTLRADHGLLTQFDGAAAPDGDRLAGLAEVFGLQPAEADLLAIAVAPDLDATVALAYDLLAGHQPSGRASVALGLELCAVPTISGHGLLDPDGTLRRTGLVELTGSGSWLRRELRVPDRVAAHLTGSGGPPWAVAAAAVDTLALGGPEADQLARAIEAGADLIWVRSLPGTPGTSVAVAGFAELGLRSLVLDARRMSSVADTLRAATLEAALGGAAVVVSGVDQLAETECREALRALAEAVVPVAAVGSGAWQAGWLRSVPLTIDAPPLTAADRAAMWQQALGAAPPPDEAGHPPLSSLRLSPEQILGAARYATTLAVSRDEPIGAHTVRDAARVLGTGAGTAGTGRVAPRSAGSAAGFADLVLPERVVADLQRLVRWAAYRDEVVARGPVHGKGGKGSGITALFTGGPGTGKTLAAHVIADELNLELLQVDLSAVVDKYIGETEKNLERIFHEAETRNVVLFFDEADALFGSRSEVRDARDRYANQEVSYLLQRMEHFDGITVLATNLRGNLDAAFSRRMQFIVHFPDPDAATRRRLWQQHLRQAGPLDEDDPVDVDALAEAVELAGGDIRNIVLAATYDATSEGRPVGMRQVREATAREYQKLGRRAPTGGLGG